jgi:hypothetical protein
MNYWTCKRHKEDWEWEEGERCLFCEEREMENNAVIALLKLDKLIDDNKFLSRVIQLIETRTEQQWMQDHQ